MTDAVHQRSIVFDAHCDTLLSLSKAERPFDHRTAEGHIDLPRLREGGVTAQIFACFVPPAERPRATATALRLIDRLYQLIDTHPHDLTLATRAEEIERAKAEGKIAAVLSLEGAEPLAGDLALLRTFYRLGVRAIGITWNHRNEAADGIAEIRSGGGLTTFGVELVQEANRLGMLIDVAHLAPAGVRDVLTISEAPVIASHANAYTLCPHPRNLSDEQLVQIAAKGGVVGVTFVPRFLTSNPGRPTLEHVLDHIDHMVRIMGVEHVGLGSDFDGFFDPPPEGLEDVSHLPALSAGLRQRNYTPEEIEKILGGNWLRVFRTVVG